MVPTIRLATEADAAAVAAIYAPFCESTAVSFEIEAPSTAEMARRIGTCLERFPWLVLEAGGVVAGYAYAGVHRVRAAYGWSAEVTVYVGPHSQRRGVGRALYASLLAMLRLQGYFMVFAGITLPNPGSVGLHEAVGFRPVGVYHAIGCKFGAWHDVAWYELPIQPLRPNPPPPRPLPDVIGSPGWDEAVAIGLTHYRPEAGVDHP